MQSINFEILRQDRPELASLGGFAEQYANPDPASALVKLRTFGEQLTKSIYWELRLPKPETDEFARRLTAPAFRDAVPKVICDKLHAIRIEGNKAAHGKQAKTGTARPKGGVKNGGGEIPSLGAEHLSDNGGFNFAKLKQVSRSFYDGMKKGKIQNQDILVVKDGATTGKVSYVNEAFPYCEAAVNEHLFRIQLDQRKACPAFVFRFLQSPIGKMQGRFVRGGVHICTSH